MDYMLVLRFSKESVKAPNQQITSVFFDSYKALTRQIFPIPCFRDSAVLGDVPKRILARPAWKGWMDWMDWLAQLGQRPLPLLM